ncbi:MAG: antibiotic biosynthesis monooxygenase family protein [Pseudomonadota bacterium]
MRRIELKAVLFALSMALAVASPVFAEDQGVTLINVFEVPADKLDESIAMWEQARDFLQAQPGYIATALHQSVQDDARFRLINIAKWESAAAFVAATQSMRETAGLQQIDGLRATPGLYTVIRD